jgi:Fur family ferric uptake transcriptional regulator
LSVATTPQAATTTTAQVDEVIELLRSRGARITTARRLLLGCLFGGTAHRSAEDLATEVRAVAPDVHLSTIYRNLDELERLGVVVGAHLGHGAACYHLASDTRGHLVCETCGTVIEASADVFEALAQTSSDRYGFDVDPRHFAVLGLCISCTQLAEPGGSGERSLRRPPRKSHSEREKA